MPSGKLLPLPFRERAVTVCLPVCKRALVMCDPIVPPAYAYLLVLRLRYMLAGDNAYPDYSNFFDGVNKADRLIFGVPGHRGIVDYRK